MDRSLVPDAVQVDIEQLALEKELGQPQDVYSATLMSIGILVFSLLLCAGLLYATFNMLHDNTQGWPVKLLLLVFVIFGLLVFSYGARCAYRDRADKTFLYENGLILKRYSGLQAIHWNQVLCTATSAFSTQEYSGLTYKLRLKNGQTIEVSRELFYRIQRRIGR